MNLYPDHIAFENRFQQLLGQKLRTVEYIEVNYHPTNPQANYQTRFKAVHCIDFAVLFYTDQAKIELHWDEQFYQYDIGIRINESTETATG